MNKVKHHAATLKLLERGRLLMEMEKTETEDERKERMKRYAQFPKGRTLPQCLKRQR